MSIIQDALKKAANSNPEVIVSTPEVIASTPENIASTPKEKKRLSRVFIFAPIVLVAVLVSAFLMLNSQLLARNAQVAPKVSDTTPPSRQEVVRKTDEVKAKAYPKAVQKPKVVQPPKYQLNGIMYIESGPKAIVNGSMVKEGDLINGAIVKKIGKQEVVLSYEDVDILLNMND